MKRSLQGAVAIVAVAAAMPVQAADYPWMTGPALRPAYADDWHDSEANPLRFETGLRYWYSWSQQQHNIGAYSQNIQSTSSSGEAFVRIDDDSTRTFVEATGGYGIMHQGSYTTNAGPSLNLPAVRLGYIGADFGWTPFGDSTVGLGFLAGYQYTNDSPDTGRANFTTARSSADISWSPTTGDWGVGGDSEVNNFSIHALKLGITGRADFGAFDLTGEAAATPYAWVTGTYGAFSAPGQSATQLQASAASINGFGYGASGKVMVGFHPTENFTIRLGGRASYLQGQYDATWDEVTITPPQPTGGNPPFSAPTLARQTYIIDNNPFSMFRYGALVELAGRF